MRTVGAGIAAVAGGERSISGGKKEGLGSAPPAVVSQTAAVLDGDQATRGHRAAPNHPCSHPLPDVGRFSYSWPASKSKPQHEGRIGHGNIAKLIETDPASNVDRRRNAVSTSGDRFPTGPSR
nr:unnamed protein product [Digitaria exilis]